MVDIYLYIENIMAGKSTNVKQQYFDTKNTFYVPMNTILWLTTHRRKLLAWNRSKPISLFHLISNYLNILYMNWITKNSNDSKKWNHWRWNQEIHHDFFQSLIHFIPYFLLHHCHLLRFRWNKYSFSFPTKVISTSTS